MNLPFTTLIHRVLKESLRSSGGNLTECHTEDVSMCALFLMEAEKKTDREYGCSQSSAHTTVDAESDINKIIGCLIDAQVALEVSNRNSPVFEQPACSTPHGSKTPCQKR